MWLSLAVPWVGLQCVIVVFPDHTHFLMRVPMPVSAKKKRTAMKTSVTKTKHFDYTLSIIWVIFEKNEHDQKKLNKT